MHSLDHTVGQGGGGVCKKLHTRPPPKEPRPVSGFKIGGGGW